MDPLGGPPAAKFLNLRTGQEVGRQQLDVLQQKQRGHQEHQNGDAQGLNQRVRGEHQGSHGDGHRGREEQ